MCAAVGVDRGRAQGMNAWDLQVLVLVAVFRLVCQADTLKHSMFVLCLWCVRITPRQASPCNSICSAVFGMLLPLFSVSALGCFRRCCRVCLFCVPLPGLSKCALVAWFWLMV